jgi:thioredoxin reductase (NADPH)
MVDLAIVGGGPAALAAALYSARAHHHTVVYERSMIGGLTAQISLIENYPGFTGNGADLSKYIKNQAEGFGAQFQTGHVTDLRRDDHGVLTLTVDGNDVTAKAVIIASGNDPRPLNIAGEESARISRCVTCDAALFRGREVVMIGGGNSAIQESVHLADYASKVTIISRSPLRANPELISRLSALPNIAIRASATIQEIATMDASTQILRLEENGREEYLQTSGIFAMIGYIPATSFLGHSGVALSEDNYVITDAHKATNIPGIFAAGDVEYGAVQQTIIATASGAAAAVSVDNYLRQAT